jgi:4-alpha-glucanotransferase
LLEWVKDRGFTGVQLGPQGETSRSNPSPYDGTSFAKTILSIALRRMAEDDAGQWEGILAPALVDDIVRNVPGSSERVHYGYVFDEHRRALASAFAEINRAGALHRRFEEWRAANASWLDRDARYESWSKTFGTDDWRSWPSSLPDVGRGDDLFAFGQFVVHTQHATFLAHAESIGLRVFGDLAIGTSHRDRFGRDALFLDRYVMGAPPSRTNPAGQPWGYPVFVPESEDVLAYMRARATKLLSELHGLRIDHPHGHICPWVYLDDVVSGARLRESPDLADHPDLARFAIARPDQIDRTVPRYAERWVVDLDDDQVTRYARQLDVLMQAAQAFGRAHDDILCEVLSTCPYPLGRVMQRYGFGRFRVTQKADPLNPTDVYRTDLTARGDWVMLGNHDTPPIWRCVEAWPDAKVVAWSQYLAPRLHLAPSSIDRASLPQAMFADLFACEAGRVGVFFADLFGMRESYNSPGVVSPDNWTLRAPRDFADHEALDVIAAMETALRARGEIDIANEVASLSS